MRYSGIFGFAESVETAPGVMTDVITEREFLGDVVQRTEAFNVQNSVLPEYRTTTSVSVLSDGVLAENYRSLRYISYMGENWSVASAVYQHPRLVVYIGDRYNGPLPQVEPDGPPEE